MTRILLLLVFVIGSALPAHAQAVLSEAIQWKWPGAHVVLRGDAVVEQWLGPMAQPTAAEIAQAVTDYTAQKATVVLDKAVANEMDTERLSSAIVWTILKQMYPADTDAQTKTKYGVARQRIIDAYKLRPWQ